MKTIQIENSQEITKIINACQVCYVSMVDRYGEPYTLPMNFAYDEGVFYLHSGPEGKKIELLKRNPKVSIALHTAGKLVYQHPDVACSYSMQSTSVVCNGEVEFIEDMPTKAKLMNAIMHHYTEREYTYNEPALRHVMIWKVVANDLSCRSFGNSAKRVI